ncbi:GNAT family N-acetyltransferase [Flavobacterium sp. CYK-55]|uniref:GNAT family N-acetyltransferase n=1 Tax=Flavobacterium sp. CYK-55 TaxID=2835529 RepID=UPI001BCC7F43|nr:GNAT family N-acetyltransferase [Flavobacterium sp. CYK-55]MBS7786665.1 GNAT family N-acetyltransferase [Flavobacterium sp. CYK-55]
MLTTTQATVQDIPVIQHLAYETWPSTYQTILMLDQVRYMLDLFYSKEALLKNFEENHEFLIIHDNQKPIGFAAFQHNYPDVGLIKLHKLYVLPSAQGLGAGQKLLDEVTEKAAIAGSKAIILNVNRFNKAYAFYRKNKFNVIQEVDLPIGHGYLMQDYVLEKKI